MKTMMMIIVPAALFFICQNTSAQCSMAANRPMKDTPAKVNAIANPACMVVYSCPMHSEVISDQPGFCPKCGMKLVEKTVSEESERQMQMHQHSMMGTGMIVMMVMMGVMMVGMMVLVGSHWH